MLKYLSSAQFRLEGTHHAFHIGGITVGVQHDHNHLPFAKGRGLQKKIGMGQNLLYGCFANLKPILKMNLIPNGGVANLLKMLTYYMYAGNNDFCVGLRLVAYLNLLRSDM